MFASESLEVDMPLAAAEHRIVSYLRVGDVDRLASAALDQGATVLARPGVGGLGKQVVVQSLPAYRRGPIVVVPLRWEATGPMARAFPVLDANLELAATETGTTLMIVGSYRPPLGELGAALDRLVLQFVARVTIRSFLNQLGQVATQLVPSSLAPLMQFTRISAAERG